MKMKNKKENIIHALELNIPFLKKFAERHPEYYGHPLLDEKEGEAFVEALHQEYRMHRDLKDPLPDIKLNIREDTLIAPGQNVVIHEIPAYMPAVMNYTDYFEVKYIRKGKCVYYTKDSSIELSKGEMIIVPPKVRQCLVVDEEHQAYNIMIRSSTFDTVFLNLVNRDDFLAEFFSEALYGAPTEYVLWHCGENPVIGDLTDRCFREFGSERPYSDRMVEALMTELFIELLREELHSKTLPELSSSGPQDTVHILIKYLQYHCADASLSDAAAVCNYSERQISRILREETGCSFTQLRQKMRLKKACELLKNPALSLGRIAGSTGFASESYFCRMFKAEYRMTPTEYRVKAVDAGT